MNFVADEGVDSPIVEQLRQAGHTVLAIAETSPGVNDETVLESAQSQQAILITGDRDFGELAYRLRRVHFGIILVRLGGDYRGEQGTDRRRSHRSTCSGTAGFIFSDQPGTDSDSTNSALN